MKVFYKIEQKDVIRMIAEKYDIKDPESQIVPYIDNSYMVDMSETETQPIGRKEKTDTAKELETILANEPAEKIDPVDDELIIDQETRYQMLTDGMIKSMLDNNKGVSEICKDYNLIDKKYAQRLYKRTEKIRSECASN